MQPFHRVSPFLSTRDLAGTVAFYRDVLGFRVETLHPRDNPTFAVLDHGGASLIFDSTLWPGHPVLTGQLHFDLGPSGGGGPGVLALLERIRGRAEVLWGPEVYGYGRREFSCRDPNGYALVFSEQTSDPPTCDDTH